MRKIIVIGCPGSGKTTFAEKLQRATNLPLYYLDAIWHKPDKTHISREDFDKYISEIFNTSKWIIDGNYNRTIEMRLQQCDTVFLFNLPTEVCIQGATDRLGKGRYDLPWIEKELDPEFEGFIKEFANKSLPRIYELIEKYKTTKQGKLIPAVANATYVIPIEMAVEFARKKNKKELIESPDVRRVSHTMEWVCNLESKIKSLMRTRGIQVDFEQENTKTWSERIRKNYLENRKKRETR